MLDQYFGIPGVADLAEEVRVTYLVFVKSRIKAWALTIRKRRGEWGHHAPVDAHGLNVIAEGNESRRRIAERVRDLAQCQRRQGEP